VGPRHKITAEGVCAGWGDGKDFERGMKVGAERECSSDIFQPLHTLACSCKTTFYKGHKEAVLPILHMPS
jgi:hypothetical protein